MLLLFVIVSTWYPKFVIWPMCMWLYVCASGFRFSLMPITLAILRLKFVHKEARKQWTECGIKYKVHRKTMHWQSFPCCWKIQCNSIGWQTFEYINVISYVLLPSTVTHINIETFRFRGMFITNSWHVTYTTYNVCTFYAIESEQETERVLAAPTHDHHDGYI